MNWIEELRRILKRVRRKPPAAGTPESVPCHEAAERIFEWLDGELDPALADSVGAHLEICGRCYPRLKFERAFLEALHRTSGGESAPEALMDRVVESLEAEGFTDA